MKNSIIIDSGFGKYLRNSKPENIANEFLYYNPTILLWADELVCDVNAINGEKKWADQGFLISEVSIILNEKNIISTNDYSCTFSNIIGELLIEESKDDAKSAENKELSAFLLPDNDSSVNQKIKRFLDINSLLFISARERIPFLPTSPTAAHFDWKYSKWFQSFFNSTQSSNKNELTCFSQLFQILVPSLTLFPKTELFFTAEKNTREMLRACSALERNECDSNYVDQKYNLFLKSWLTYDKSVKSEVFDNLDVIYELRNDRKLIKLRQFIKEFSESIQNPDSLLTKDEVDLKLKRRLLEIEHEVAHKITKYEMLDIYGSQFSFPIEAITVLGGIAGTVITENPFFAALGVVPSFLSWLSKNLNRFSNRQYIWQSYLRNTEEKIQKKKKLLEIDREIKALENKEKYC